MILRVYEGLGGHASAELAISRHLKVQKASLVNLLEEDEKDLGVLQTNDVEHPQALRVKFHGFQVQTIKLTLETISHRREVLQ